MYGLIRGFLFFICFVVFFAMYTLYISFSFYGNLHEFMGIISIHYLMHSLLDGATLGDLSSQPHGGAAWEASTNNDISTAVTLDAISLTDDVIGNGSTHAQAVEHPVAGVEGIPC